MHLNSATKLTTNEKDFCFINIKDSTDQFWCSLFLLSNHSIYNKWKGLPFQKCTSQSAVHRVGLEILCNSRISSYRLIQLNSKFWISRCMGFWGKIVVKGPPATTTTRTHPQTMPLHGWVLKYLLEFCSSCILRKGLSHWILFVMYIEKGIVSLNSVCHVYWERDWQ